jgi:predicted AlkP superfamily phosphohydrolase/phosphomutase
VKLLIVGLDCAEPSLVFDRWRDRLPNLSRLMDGGSYGQLISSIPAMTVPAWACMMSGKDPGQLGFYDFRNRADYSYEYVSLATASSVKVDRVWDMASRAGRQAIIVSVPQTFPVRPVNGVMVSCFLTPSTRSQFTYPPELKQEIAQLIAGDFLVDVPQFRTDDKDQLLAQIYEMSDQHHTLVKHLLTTRPWDLFMHVDIGVDRIHHAFWKYFDPRHPRHEPGNPYETAVHDYYVHVDAQIGEWLSLLDGETAVLVVSDHGGQPMMGGLCINEWLKQEGYLVLEDQPAGIVPLEKCEVDWSRTTAWASGGYCSRLHLNVRGREPEGIVDPADYERVRDEIATGIAAIPLPVPGRDQACPPSLSFKPDQIYAEVHGVAPDLIVYPGNLSWRAVGSLGWNGLFSSEQDGGPDDANHRQEGLYIYYNPGRPGRGRTPEQHILDVAPTVLELLGLEPPSDLRGKSFA